MVKLPIFIIAAMIISGCGGKESSPTSTEFIPTAVLSVYPSDGSSNIRLDESVLFQFPVPIDRAIFEKGFRIVSTSSLTDSLCPQRNGMRHGMYSSIMSDTALLLHSINIHSVTGRFDWNESSTLCRFYTSDAMPPLTQFMVVLMPSTVSLLRQINVLDSTKTPVKRTGLGDMISYHFTTLDTTKSGHSTHH